MYFWFNKSYFGFQYVNAVMDPWPHKDPSLGEEY
jgi:hypothetical protein